MARPKKDIDPNMVRALAGKFCTLREIGAVLGCSASTIQRRFATECHEGREQGKTRLRNLQWAAAEKGSDRMLIHLGEQYLDQIKRQEIRMEATVDEQRQQFVARRLAEVDRLLAGPRGGGGPAAAPGGNGNGRAVGGNGQGGSIEPA